jgi:iron-sulfur cluster assembly protein
MSTANPIQFSKEAKDYFLHLLYSNAFPEPYVRIGMNGGACGGSFVLGFDSKADFDDEFLIENIPVIIDRRQLLFVMGTEVAFESRANGFYLHKPPKL